MLNFLKKKAFYNFSIFLVIVSAMILTSNQIIVIRKEIIENKKIDNVINQKEVINYKNDYVAVLEIPKIGFRKGLVDADDKNNMVDENIQIISSDISNIDSGTIILAAHSGSGYKAFFKNLDKMELGDDTYIYYDGRKYYYIVTDIYIEDKDGNIEIPTSNNLLVLTTCYEKEEQLVVILEQKDHV